MKRVLLITSDLTTSSTAAGAAKRSTVELQTAFGVAAAEAKLAQGPPALVILDLSTAGLNVSQFVPELRGRIGHDIPIIAFGPHVRTAELAAAREAGCDLVVSRGEFHARVDDYLRQFCRDG